MKSQVVIASLVISFLLIGITAYIVLFQPTTLSTLFYGQQSIAAPKKGLVTHVVDGDTIVIDGTHTIRLLNIDTPESAKPNTPPECFSKQASNWLASVLNNKSVVLKYDKELKDKYDRWLAWVWIEGEGDTSNPMTSLNAESVHLGYASILSISPNTTYSREFLKLEKEAKLTNRGRWKACSI